MAIYLFISLGTRDIQLKNLEKIEEKIGKDKYKELIEDIKYPKDKKFSKEFNVRKFGHWLKNNFENIKDDIELPMIEPVLDDVSKKGEIKKIFLIATDQKKENEHFERDTCVSAKFLRDMYFPYYYKETKPEVEILILEGKPNDYDLMIKEFSKHLEKIQPNTTNKDKFYAEITGGTPQISLSVIINCIRFLQDRVDFIYKPENSNEVKILNLGAYILKSYEHEALIRLAERYDFDAIAQNENYPEFVRELAKSAAYRLNFDFFAYRKKIKNIRLEEDKKEWIEELKSLIEDTRKLFEKEPASLFNELYWNAVIMWERDECANFVGRVWRIIEAVMHYSLLNVVDCSWEEMKNDNDTFKDSFKEWANKNDKFFNFLKQKTNNKNNKYGLNGSKIEKGQLKSTIPILHACIDFIIEKKRNGSGEYEQVEYDLEGLSKYIESLREFTDKRNKSIIAHGFEPISKETIDASLENKDIIEITRSMIECVRLKLSEQNPFDVFKDLIVEYNEYELNKTLEKQ